MKQELIHQLNGYLANVGVSYVKLHNLHWNVVGGQFKAVHEYLETLYDGFAQTLDAVAELLKMNGAAPLASMRDYLSAATIQELDSQERDVKTVLTVTLADMETLMAQAEAIRTAADEADDYAAANRMESDLEQYSKTVWFLHSMLK